MPLIILRDLFFSNLPDYFRQAEAFHKLNIVFHQMIFIVMRNGLALFQCKSNPCQKRGKGAKGVKSLLDSF